MSVFLSPQQGAMLLRAARIASWVLLSAALPAAATPGVDEPPAPGPVRAPVVPNFEEAALPNGVRVVLAARRDTPLVSAMLMVRAGAEVDPADRAGLASMTAELLTRGAERAGRRLGATQIAEQAEMLGASVDSSASWRALRLSMTVAAPRLAEAVALMADLLRRPNLDADELDRLRALQSDALKVALVNPSSLAGMAMRRSYWGDSAYGAVITPDTLARIQRADVVQFHHLHVQPASTVLIVAGDASMADAMALARRHLGDWTASSVPAATVAATPPQPVAPRMVIIDLPGAGQSGVAVAAPYIPAGSPERRIGQVANAVLGGGYSARLNQEVRIKRGLSYGAQSDAESTPAGGMIVARAQTNHPTAAQTVELLQAEFVRMGTTEPTVDELAARKATLVGGFGRALETTGGLAATVAEQISRDRPLIDLQQTPAQLIAVTAAQVREFAAARWKPEALRTVIVGDVKAAGDSLQPLLGQDATLKLQADGLKLERPGLR